MNCISRFERQLTTSITLLALASLFFLCSPASAAERRMPGEFEHQEAVWTAWPTYNYLNAYPVEPLVMALIKELGPYVKVKLLVQDEADMTRVKGILKKNNIPIGHVEFVQLAYKDVWMSDNGPVFAINEAGEKEVIDFNYNTYSMLPFDDPYTVLEESVDRRAAFYTGVGFTSTRLTMEGGNLEPNGKGVMIVCEQTFVKRNPHWSKADMTAELKRLFGLEKVIWIRKGPVEDDASDTKVPGPNGEDAYRFGTDGHIDSFCRFADANTILLAEVTEKEAMENPIAAMNKKVFDDAYQILSNATDQDENPFKILRMPCPSIGYTKCSPGDSNYEWMKGLTMTDCTTYPEKESVNWLINKGYLCFLATNGAVVVPQYGGPDKKIDEHAIKVFKQAFSGRKIIGLDFLPVNVGGGGINCITTTEPS